MTATAEKLIKYAASQKMTKEEWEEAIDYLYAAQVDIQLEESGNDVSEHIVTMNGSRVTIVSVRELLN